MERLRQLLEEMGCSDVRTYIQSGNVAFSTSIRNRKKLTDEIVSEVATQCGLNISLLLKSQTELQQILDGNPFTEEPEKSVIVFLLEKKSSTPLEELKPDCSESEVVSLTDTAMFLHAPDGIARSKIAREAEKRLGVMCTARNVRTLTKLLELC